MGSAIKAGKGAIDNLIRGGSKGSQATITSFSDDAARSGASGGVLASIRSAVGAPFRASNSVMSRLPGGLGRRAFTIAGIPMAVGTVIVVLYLGYRWMM